MSTTAPSQSINKVNSLRANRGTRALIGTLICTIGLSPMAPVMAGPPPTVTPLINLFNQPPIAGENVPPSVMITASKDQQLFKKAYDDYSDLDGDGQLETTYKHSIDYYGYFDTYKCYSYSDSDRRYNPVSITTSKYCSGNWSGNFLNWASMTRIDALRKVLYGGLRSPNRSGTGGDADGLGDGDVLNSTVLERSYLPTDAHAFTKYYDGNDLQQLTPFDQGLNVADAVSTTYSPNRPIENGINSQRHFVQVAGGLGFATGNLVEIADANGNRVRGKILEVVTIGANRGLDIGLISSTSGGGTNVSGLWTVNNLTLGGPGAVGTSIAYNMTRPVQNAITTESHFVKVGDAQVFIIGDVVELRDSTGRFVRGKVLEIIGNGSARSIDIGDVTSINVSGSGVNASGKWQAENLSRRGITICNTTNGGSGIQQLSNTNTNLPRMKIARGNHSIWNASERWQCTWNEEHSTYNGNDFAASGIPASGTTPSRTAVGLDQLGKGNTTGVGDYFVRVKVCVPSLIGKEKCKPYTNGDTKPIGLLQTFGETDRIRFGLITGSYLKNISGGVLRKNISKINDEIDLATGQFIVLPNSGVGASPSPGLATYNFEGGSIIKTLSAIRMTGYEYGSGNYFGGVSDDSCSYQRQLNTNGACRSWGNPISEMFYETLRYYGGLTAPTPGFVADDTSVIASLATAKWPDQAKALLNEANDSYCSPISALVINAATSTNEADADIAAMDLSFMAGTPGTATQQTNKLGNDWGLTGNFYMGYRIGDAPNSPGFNSCTSKTLTGLGDVRGLCPEGPTTNGSYLMAGMAYYAHNYRVRKDIPVTGSDLKLKNPLLKLDTYGVSLSSGVPRIPIKFSGDAAPRATIQPSYQLVLGAVKMGGALVDLRVLSQVEEVDRSTGRIFVSFEDSEGGGDYDMDVWGIITYEMTQPAFAPVKLTVTTDVVFQATGNPQGFGYIVAGTNRDGQHFHSGILGFNYNDVTAGMVVTGDAGKINATGGCSNCQREDGPSTATYAISNTPLAKSLEEPLYYAALFGGFKDGNNDGKPNYLAPTGSTFPRTEYDRRNNATGADEPDGIPDNYFKVSNPLGLEVGLERTFQSIADKTSRTSVASASTRVRANNKIYEAKFNSEDWSGDVEARLTTASGQYSGIAWSAANGLGLSTDENTRKIITISDDSRTGTAFRWSNLTATQQAALNTLPVGSDTRGEERLRYIRGEGTNEGLTSGKFRLRAVTKLGDIANSNPTYVGKPAAGFINKSYAAFANIPRTPMVYVGANDGMLHGFNADTGAEVFAYVPSNAFKPASGVNFSRLAGLTQQEYVHTPTVDGQITVQDIQVGGVWKSHLVAGLGKGGQGVFSLDVTDPTAFTEGNAASVVKWEFTGADDPAMGYVFADPVIRKLPNGKWAALISSGYNANEPDGSATTNGRAYLFVLFMDGPTGAGRSWVEGSDYVKIEIPAGTASQPNGLGGISTWDTEADGITDYAYGGDLLGNMWRIPFTGASPTAWADPTKIKKLFTASAGGLTQPITAAPRLIDGPGYNGVMVVFGTGKLLEQKDLASANFQTQTMYGILDKLAPNPATINRADLMEQKIIDSEIVDGTKYSLLTKFIPNYTSVTRSNPRFGSANPLATGPTATTPPQSGWRLEMPSSNTTGERSIYKPVVTGALVVFATAIPSKGTSKCSIKGTGSRYALDVYTGGRAPNGGFDRNGDDSINSADMSTFGGVGAGGNPAAKFYSSVKEQGDGYGQITILADGADPERGASSRCQRALAYSSVGDQPDRLPGGCAARIQWREVLQ